MSTKTKALGPCSNTLGNSLDVWCSTCARRSTPNTQGTTGVAPPPSGVSARDQGGRSQIRAEEALVRADRAGSGEDVGGGLRADLRVRGAEQVVAAGEARLGLLATAQEFVHGREGGRGVRVRLAKPLCALGLGLGRTLRTDATVGVTVWSQCQRNLST